MLGQKDRRQPELFVAGSRKDLLPEDHVLVRVDKVLDLGWLEAEVADLYSTDKGRPGIAPEVAVRLMLNRSSRGKSSIRFFRARAPYPA